MRRWFGTALIATLLAGCESSMPAPKPPGGLRDINVVIADHDKRLMALPGVVGVYVGLMDDNATPCLKVMLAREDPQVRRSIPREIEGYRVITEVTGEIKPMAPGVR